MDLYPQKVKTLNLRVNTAGTYMSTDGTCNLSIKLEQQVFIVESAESQGYYIWESVPTVNVEDRSVRSQYPDD